MVAFKERMKVNADKMEVHRSAEPSLYTDCYLDMTACIFRKNNTHFVQAKQFTEKIRRSD